MTIDLLFNPYKKFPYFVISHSSTTSFEQGCERRFEFTKLYEGLGDNTDLPPRVGHAIHAGMADYAVNQDEDSALLAMMLEYPIELNSDPHNYRSLEACVPTLQEMMRSYAFTSHRVVDVDVNGKRKPAIEVPFRLRLKGTYLNKHALERKREFRKIPIYFDGVIDIIMENVMTGEIEVFDFKSHRRNVKDISSLFEFDDQCIPYSIVIQHILGLSIEEFKYNYITGYIDLRNPQAQFLEYQKTQEDVQEWVAKLQTMIRNLQWYYYQRRFPRRHQSCSSWGKKCSYFDYCKSRDTRYLAQIFTKKKEPRTRQRPWVIIDMELA